jgi:hypothetical protein
MILETKLKEVWGQRDAPKVLSQRLLIETEENHEDPQAGYQFCDRQIRTHCRFFQPNCPQSLFLSSSKKITVQ